MDGDLLDVINPVIGNERLRRAIVWVQDCDVGPEGGGGRYRSRDDGETHFGEGVTSCQNHSRNWRVDGRSSRNIAVE